jgi:predicted Rossmann-fold nucleotide-binding protein
MPLIMFVSSSFNTYVNLPKKRQVPQVITSEIFVFSVDPVLGKKKEFLESTNHLGQVLVERKIHLVYGGGSLGLMGGGNSCIFRR